MRIRSALPVKNQLPVTAGAPPLPYTGVIGDATAVNIGWTFGDSIIVPIVFPQEFTGTLIGYSVRYRATIAMGPNPSGSQGSMFHGRLGNLRAGLVQSPDQTSGRGLPIPDDATLIDTIWDAENDPMFAFATQFSPGDYRSLTNLLPQPLTIDRTNASALGFGLWINPSIGPVSPNPNDSRTQGPTILVNSAEYSIIVDGQEDIPTL